MNTDVCGIGVRIAFYLQTFFLACWSLRSCAPHEVTSALYTVVITNMAMTITVLMLGLKPEPEISFHDALIAFYLLLLSTVTVTFCLSRSRNLSSSFLVLLSIVQSYTFFALGFIILATADTFGNAPTCNNNGLIVVFQSGAAGLPSGRVIGYILVIGLFLAYTGYLIQIHAPAFLKQKAYPPRDLEGDLELTQRNPNAGRNNYMATRANPELWNIKLPPIFDSINFDIILIGKLVVIVGLWIAGAVNSELLIKRSNFATDPDARSEWQFGQVLPMLLVIIPLVGMLESFREHKFRRVNLEERSRHLE